MTVAATPSRGITPAGETLRNVSRISETGVRSMKIKERTKIDLHQRERDSKWACRFHKATLHTPVPKKDGVLNLCLKSLRWGQCQEVTDPWNKVASSTRESCKGLCMGAKKDVKASPQWEASFEIVKAKNEWALLEWNIFFMRNGTLKLFLVTFYLTTNLFAERIISSFNIWNEE